MKMYYKENRGDSTMFCVVMGSIYYNNQCAYYFSF